MAKTLGLETKAVLEHCRDLGFDVKNQLSSLESEQVDFLKGKIATGARPSAPAAPAPSKLPTPPRKTEAMLGKLECIPLLAEIDVEAAMFKVRQITERLCRKILRAAGVKEKELSNLNAMIDAIASRKLLTPKAVHHLDSIRALGNGATHNTDDLFAEEFTLHDVNSASSSLASVLDAAIKTGKL